MQKTIRKVLSVVLVVVLLATICVSSVSAYKCSGSTYSNTNDKYKNGVFWTYEFLSGTGDWNLRTSYNNMADTKLTGSHWTTAVNDLKSTGVSEYSVDADVSSFSGYTNYGILAGGYKCGVFEYNNGSDLNYGRMGLYSANWQALGQSTNGAKKPLLIEANTQYKISVEFLPLSSYSYQYSSQIAIGYMGVDGSSAVKVLGDTRTFGSHERVLDSKKPIKASKLRGDENADTDLSAKIEAATNKIQTISYTLTADKAATLAGKQFCLVFGTQRATSSVAQVAHATASTWRLSQFLIRKVTIETVDMSGSPKIVNYQNSPAGISTIGTSVDGNITLPALKEETGKELFWLDTDGKAALQGTSVQLTDAETTFTAIESVGDRAASISKDYAKGTLRLRGDLPASVVNAADEIGYVAIPTMQNVISANWYNMAGVDTSAGRGVNGYAQWAKINNFKTEEGYYSTDGDVYTYQIALTKLSTDAHKQANFSVAMYVKTGEDIQYFISNNLSYNTVKQAYIDSGVADAETKY